LGAAKESIAGSLKVDALLPHSLGEPVVLVETHPRGEGEIGAEANEHRTPVAIVDVKVILHDPALGQLQVPAVLFLVADGDQDAPWFSCFEDHDDLIRLGVVKIASDKIIAPTLRSIQDWSLPFCRLVRYPVVKLFRNFAENIATDRVLIAMGAKETDDAFGLLEGLD